MLRPDDKPLCAEVDPELFFPEPSHEARRQEVMIESALQALTICSKCPIREACLEYGLSDYDLANWGIYGGSLSNERLAVTGHPKLNNYHENTMNTIRRHATARGIPAPTLGGKPLNAISLTQIKSMYKDAG
jgi:WhiB family redox-sensing transcriptional regulator